MNQKSTIKYEILLAAIIAALILLPQLIGTATVTDETAGLDENGCPVATKTLEDLEAPGFGKMQTFRSVIFPQALVHFLPSYSGQFIATVKMTAVAGYISVVDLTKASDIIRSRTYEAFFPLFFTSLVYFLLCTLLVSLLRILEKKIHPERTGILSKKATSFLSR